MNVIIGQFFSGLFSCYMCYMFYYISAITWVAERVIFLKPPLTCRLRAFLLYCAKIICILYMESWSEVWHLLSGAFWFHDGFFSILNHEISWATFPLQTLVIYLHNNQKILDWIGSRQQFLFLRISIKVRNINRSISYDNRTI